MLLHPILQSEGGGYGLERCGSDEYCLEPGLSYRAGTFQGSDLFFDPPQVRDRLAWNHSVDAEALEGYGYPPPESSDGELTYFVVLYGAYTHVPASFLRTICECDHPTKPLTSAQKGALQIQNIHKTFLWDLRSFGTSKGTSIRSALIPRETRLSRFELFECFYAWSFFHKHFSPPPSLLHTFLAACFDAVQCIIPHVTGTGQPD